MSAVELVCQDFEHPGQIVILAEKGRGAASDLNVGVVAPEKGSEREEEDNGGISARVDGMGKRLLKDVGESRNGDLFAFVPASIVPAALLHVHVCFLLSLFFSRHLRCRCDAGAAASKMAEPAEILANSCLKREA